LVYSLALKAVINFSSAFLLSENLKVRLQSLQLRLLPHC
jgi:hypothetical protein